MNITDPDERAGYVMGLLHAANLAEAMAMGIEMGGDSPAAKVLRELTVLLHRHAEDLPDA